MTPGGSDVTGTAFENPGRDCPLCPRLVAFRTETRVAQPQWWNAPVPSFGSLNASILILGLAPGMQGANRTGRPFTGDWAGDLLYKVLVDLGLAQGNYDRRPDDGLTLIECRIANAVRCVPPQNKPIGQEMTASNEAANADQGADDKSTGTAVGKQSGKKGTKADSRSGNEKHASVSIKPLKNISMDEFLTTHYFDKM